MRKIAFLAALLFPIAAFAQQAPAPAPDFNAQACIGQLGQTMQESLAMRATILALQDQVKNLEAQLAAKAKK